MKNIIILLIAFLLTKTSSAQKAVVTVDKITCQEDLDLQIKSAVLVKQFF